MSRYFFSLFNLGACRSFRTGLHLWPLNGGLRDSGIGLIPVLNIRVYGSIWTRPALSVMDHGMLSPIFHVCECQMLFMYSGTGADISNTSVPFPLPGDPGDLITSYPEGFVYTFLHHCIVHLTNYTLATIQRFRVRAAILRSTEHSRTAPASPLLI